MVEGQAPENVPSAFVFGLLANGSLLNVLAAGTITLEDLSESFSLFRTGCNLVTLQWRADCSLVTPRVVPPLAV